MKLRILAVALVLAAVAPAQQKLGTVNTETPEGQLLQQIGQESDEAKKLALLEAFAAKHATHESIGWVWSQMQAGYLKANQPDKALEAGEKLAAKDPNDLEAAYQNLKAGEAKKDADMVKKWSARTSQLAMKAAQSEKPKEDDEAEAWKAQVERAKQVNTYTEYSLYATTLQTTDPRKRVELVDALMQQNPKSEYLPKVWPLQLDAYNQLKDNTKALATAESILAIDPNNEDALVFAADQYSQKKGDPEKIIAYANKAAEVLAAKPKPEGVDDAAWAKKKAALSGVAHFMAGSTYYNQKKLKQADQSLRAGLPFTEGNDQLKAATLFYLGLVNHSMKNMKDAVAFSQQCAAIKSPFQAKANENLKVMRGPAR